ncbi:hypothetical protein HMPREF3230_00020 [Gardnerella vaginalis]|uniref:Uncharacterized protein n=1 Tax=Gardnerella vaginalis TaxID=2702 RepID=A0A135ZC32_GARVA|nr:hypothetical protein HMPREF3230_00020 [Gardnerella vaginalis]
MIMHIYFYSFILTIYSSRMQLDDVKSLKNKSFTNFIHKN